MFLWAATDGSADLLQSPRHVSPGGYVELVENYTRLLTDDNSLPEDSPLSIYYDVLEKALAGAGLFLLTGSALKSYMEEAGFVDVTVCLSST